MQENTKLINLIVGSTKSFYNWAGKKRRKFRRQEQNSRMVEKFSLKIK